MKKPLDVIAGLGVGSRASGCVLSGFTPSVSRVTSLRPDGHSDNRYLPTAVLIIASLALTACTSQPVVRVQYIETKVYIPTPSTLVAPVISVLPLGTTYGEAIGIQQAAIKTCNGQLKAISELVPPK